MVHLYQGSKYQGRYLLQNKSVYLGEDIYSRFDIFDLWRSSVFVRRGEEATSADSMFSDLSATFPFCLLESSSIAAVSLILSQGFSVAN